jgi:hypothetical protein
MVSPMPDSLECDSALNQVQLPRLHLVVRGVAVKILILDPVGGLNA